MKPDEEAESEDEPEWVQSFHDSQAAAESGDIKEAEALSLQTFVHIMEEAAKKPPAPHLSELKLAHECEANADWEGAEVAFKRAVALEIELHGYAVQTLKSLARFYHFRNREREALETVHAATEAARQMGRDGIFLATALQTEISYLFGAGENEKARPLLDEALQIVENDPYCKSLLHHFRFYEVSECVHSGNLDGAEALLNEMWPQVEQWQQAMFMMGHQSALASWWQLRALCCQKRGQVSEEIEALRRVVHFQHIIAQAPQLEGPYKFNALAGALHKLGAALQQNGDALALQVLAESASLRRDMGLEPLQ